MPSQRSWLERTSAATGRSAGAAATMRSPMIVWRRMETHTILGEQMLGGVAFLQGEGLRVVRSHHERWDGTGYPDGMSGTEIPLGARIFAVADTLDAMTSDRPYRRAVSWAAAGQEILMQSKRQFDPKVVKAFVASERSLRGIRREFALAA